MNVARSRLGVLSLALGAALGAQAEQAPEATKSPIQWEVQESFPLLPHAVVEDLRKTGHETATAVYTHLVSRWRPGQPILAPVESTQYDRQVGRYKQGYLLAPGETVAIFAALNAHHDSRCLWSVRSEATQIATVEGRCGDWQSLNVPLEAKLLLSATVLDTSRQRTFSQPITVRQSVTVAIGDSYAAGQGNPDIPADNRSIGDARSGSEWPFISRFPKTSAAQWWDEPCQRSLVSWPVLTALTQALQDRMRQTRHVLLSYACSGAEIVDGGFLAQTKSAMRSREYAVARDGAFDGAHGDELVWRTQLHRSQINQMFDDLCRGQERQSRLVSVPARGAVRAWVHGCAQPLPVDRLLLSMGGNDLGFANLAMGIFIPDQARAWYFAPVLALFRFVAQAESLEGALKTAQEYRKVYPEAIRTLREATGVSAARTVLVRYPNPVVSLLDDKRGGPSADDGCVNGGRVRVPGSSDTTTQRVRIRDVNLVLGSALPKGNFLGLGRGWTLSAEPQEVGAFLKIYRNIELMQKEAVDREGGQMLDATYGNSSLFEGRRMCDKVESADAVYLPLYMCGRSTNEEKAFRECQIGDQMGQGQWRPRPPSDYLHYRGMIGEREKRTMAYSLNETVLSQRSWTDPNPGAEAVRDALAGAMHPTGEAHAAAADSILDAISRVERRPQLP